jgi:uncharacterized protein YciI
MKLPPATGLMLAACFLAATMVHAAEPAPARPAFAMTTYYFCLLTKGPNRENLAKEEIEKIQAGHMANIRRLAGEGKILVAGPFADDGDWRGIFIFKCATLEEAKALVATDPAIVAGRLKAEIHPWMTAQGYIRDPEFPMAEFAPITPAP